MKRTLIKMIQTFEVWHKRIVSLCGLRRSICLIVMGVFAALSFPPVYLVPALIPSIAILIWSLDRWGGRIEKNDEIKIDWQSIWGSFLTGWFFGFGFFVAGFYWISLSLLVDSERWAWMLPFSIVGLGGFFAIFPPDLGQDFSNLSAKKEKKERYDFPLPNPISFDRAIDTTNQMINILNQIIDSSKGQIVLCKNINELCE